MSKLKISQYKKNILQLFSGTAISQLIPLLSSPVLTRIYTPGDFGYYATFLAYSAILTIIVTLRLEMAIVLPDSDKEAKNLTTLTISISLLINIILILLFLFLYFICNLSFQLGVFILLLPFSVLINSFYTAFYYFSLRNKKFKLLAGIRIFVATTILVTSILIPLMGITLNGLILANIISYMLSIPILIVKNNYKFDFLKFIHVKRLLTKFSNFPKLDLPTAFMIQLSNRLPVLMLSKVFPEQMIGYYSLSQRMIDTPTAFVTSAISDSFKQKATYDYNKTGSLLNVFKETRKLLIVLAIFPYILIQFFAVDIFSFIFGAEWAIAGLYSQILAPLFLLKFIIGPLTYTLYVKNKLNYNLYGQVFKLLMSFAALLIGNYYKNMELGLLLFTITNSVIYVIYYIVSFKLARS